MLTQALLVDDSRSVLNFLKRHIEAEGLVEATTFLDPVEAPAFARERVFDLVLLDYEMPHMDGISFHPRTSLPSQLAPTFPIIDDHLDRQTDDSPACRPLAGQRSPISCRSGRKPSK